MPIQEEIVCLAGCRPAGAKVAGAAIGVGARSRADGDRQERDRIERTDVANVASVTVRSAAIEIELLRQCWKILRCPPVDRRNQAAAQTQHNEPVRAVT